MLTVCSYGILDRELFYQFCSRCRGSESTLVARHHSNWRVKALEAVDRPRRNDLHYTCIMGVSHDSVRWIREQLLELLQKTEPVIKAAKEETAAVLLLDLYEI